MIQPMQPFMNNSCVDSEATVVGAERIHQNALRIAHEVGLVFHDAEARDILASHGARVEDKRVYLPPELVMRSLDNAPHSFTLHGADPAKSLIVGGENRILCPGFGAASVIGWDGSKRDGTMDDYINFSKLSQACGVLGVNGGPLVQVGDLPVQNSHLAMMYAAYMLSDQPMMGISTGGRTTHEICDLAEIRMAANPEAQGQPGVLFMISTLSPLQFDEAMSSTMLAAIRRGQGVIISPAPTAGITGPIELAGNLSMATAEALAVITLGQCERPGCPMVFGLQCFDGDMRFGTITVGSPQYPLQARYNAVLARKYGMPCRGGGSPSDAKAVNAQAGMESMLNLISSYSHGFNLVVHAAGILDRFSAMSYEKFILDLEGISMAETFYGSITAENEDDLAFELIKNIGPGGNYLVAADTFMKARSLSWQSVFNPKAVPGGSMDECLRESFLTRQTVILATYQIPEIDDEIMSKMDAYMLKAGIDSAVIEQVKSARSGEPG
jgi:trimethylamine--corrinoid protein Co-methyltransferase